MEENNREIMIGKNRLYLDENNILNMTLVGELNEKLVINLINAIQQLENMVEGKVSILTDINKAGIQSVKARKLLKEQSEKSEKAGKIAVYGLHPVARVIASFFINITRKKDIHFFKSQKEALIWLMEGKLKGIDS